MIAVLSPAKNLNDSCGVDVKTTTPKFKTEANYLANKLKKMSAKKIGTLMNLSSSLADLNYERYQQWEDDFENSDLAQPAGFLFAGDVYRGLDSNTIAEQNYEYFNQNILMLSGLYGVVHPFDKILPYRLEMGTSWKITPKQKNLYDYWGDKVQKHILSLLKKQSSDHLINLASNEYFKVLKGIDKKVNVITPSFKDFKNGEYKSIMVYAKKARGLMARFMVDYEINEIEKLKAFDSEGYYFSPNHSDDTNWVFLRDEQINS